MSDKLEKMDVINTIYRSLLGREMNPFERSACEQVEMSDPSHVAALVDGAIRSDEFFSRHFELFFQKLIPKPIFVIARTPLGQEIIVDLHQLHLGFSMAAGHFEPDEVSVLKNIVKRDMLAVDIGANIGFYTLMLAGLVGDAGKVIAFEPVPDSRSKLSISVTRNRLDHIVQIESCALSSSNGQVQIVHDIDTINIGGAHISEDAGLLPREGTVCHTVTTRKLDEFQFNRRIDFIKMDVEGAEGLVVRGAVSTLRRDMPVMLVEFNDSQLRAVSKLSSEALAAEYLALGYRLFKFAGNGRIAAMCELVGQEVTRLLAPTGIFNCLLIPSTMVDRYQHLMAGE